MCEHEPKFKRDQCWKCWMGVGQARNEPEKITRHGTTRGGDLPLTTILRENAKAQPIPERYDVGRHYTGGN